MLEDSISSSPSKSNKSIHETRLKRKNKRKKVQHSEQINNDHERNVDHQRFMFNFYADSDDSINDDCNGNNTSFFEAKSPAIVSNYKPFELEKAFAIADRLPIQQNSCIKHNLVTETQGFVNCVNLTEMESANISAVHLNDKSKQNSSFNITESEMINCCHEAEQNLQLTPKKDDDMFLVNSILEDFSQSPLSKEQTKINTSWIYTPEFRMRRQPVKTYSRKFLNKTKTNLNERFEEENLASDDDDMHSSSTSLSVQEDATVGEITNNQPTIASLNNSRLCENLLNLSVYFSQNNESQESLYDERDNLLISSSIPNIINDILNLRSKIRNGNHYDTYSSMEDFMGFPSYNEDNKNNTIDVDSSEHNSIHTTLNITQDLNISNDRLLDITLKGDEKAMSEDWNDENCRDILACINTENILNQQNFIKNNNEFSVPLKSDNSEKHIVSELQIENEIPNFANGFKTASSKPIRVSKEAHIMAAKILSKLPELPEFKEKSEDNNCDTNHLNDVNIFENPEDYEWNDDCDLFLNFQTPIAPNEKLTNTSKLKNNTNEQLQEVNRPEDEVPSTSKIASIGFKTAAGKNVHISRKAQESVQNLLKEIVNIPIDNSNCEEELREMKSKVYAKAHKLEAKQNSPNRTNQSNDISTVKQIIDTKIGFQTARGNKITISEKAKQSVESILHEFNFEPKDSIEDDLEDIKQKIYKKNKKSKHTMSASYGSEDEINNLISVNMPQISGSSIGFQTVKGNKIITPTKAQQSVENLLKECLLDDTKNDFLSDFKCDKNDINRNKKEIERMLENRENNEDLSGILLSEWPLEKPLEMYKDENKYNPITTKSYNEIKITDETSLENNNIKQTENINRGFQTANGKQVSISIKAQEMVKKLLQEFNTDSGNENYENDLLAIKTKIQYNNKELKANDSSKPKSSQEDNEYALSSKNITPKPIRGKRKYSIDNSEISPRVSISPPPKILNKGPNNSKSSLAEQSLKSPLTLASHSVISRKNLLSLTKRRKNKRNSLSIPSEEIPKINKEKYDLNQDVATPIKPKISLRTTEQTPATPNLKEFFSDAPLTSTPRINQITTPQQIIMDSDFKPISWKNNESTSNSITHTTKLSESSSSNITLNSSNPTAKERIGRLKMYGKAPAVSPILIETQHNCRPSGLRRTRSMLKKSEN